MSEQVINILDLRNSNLESINESRRMRTKLYINNQTNIRNLDISINFIEEIPLINNLRSLVANNNRIKKIETNENLRELDLSRNRIQNINFIGFNNLTYLKMNHNFLSSINYLPPTIRNINFM